MGYALGQSDYQLFIVKTPSTADSDDTIDMTSELGGASIIGVIGVEQDTPAQEQPTWNTSTDVITLGGSSNDDVVRYLWVWATK